jgi:hypothetical protein
MLCSGSGFGSKFLAMRDPDPPRMNAHSATLATQMHCEKCRRTFRWPLEEYLSDVEKIQYQCQNFLFTYLCGFFPTLLSNEKVRH